MPPTAPSDHGRTQTLLLISKLLDSQPGLSPLTLLVDSLEQSAKPLLRECIRRAVRTKTRTIFVSFETLRPPAAASAVIHAHALTLTSVGREIQARVAEVPDTKTLILLDTLHPLLAALPPASPQSFLLPLITPSTSLLAVHHADVPLPPPRDLYAPPPAKLASFLATTVLTLHAHPHVLAAEAARMRAQPAPAHGLREHAEGVLRGLRGARAGSPAVVVEMEHRRRSGRVVSALFVLRGGGSAPRLLDEDPGWREVVGARVSGSEAGDGATASDSSGLTFSLGLTEKQRREREGVVLPYFDAQNAEGGPGEGGRILYEMGVEDDFDEEEDEI